MQNASAPRVDHRCKLTGLYAFASVAKTGEPSACLSHHGKMNCLLAQKPSDGAKVELCLCTAIEIARRQSARSPELRATTSLARLLAPQGRRDEARRHLRLVH
jgi:hypothetical protein